MYCRIRLFSHAFTATVGKNIDLHHRGRPCTAASLLRQQLALGWIAIIFFNANAQRLLCWQATTQILKFGCEQRTLAGIGTLVSQRSEQQLHHSGSVTVLQRGTQLATVCTVHTMPGASLAARGTWKPGQVSMLSELLGTGGTVEGCQCNPGEENVDNKHNGRTRPGWPALGFGCTEA